MVDGLTVLLLQIRWRRRRRRLIIDIVLLLLQVPDTLAVVVRLVTVVVLQVTARTMVIAGHSDVRIRVDSLSGHRSRDGVWLDGIHGRVVPVCRTRLLNLRQLAVVVVWRGQVAVHHTVHR